MTSFKTAPSALFVCLLGTTALADVSAQQVWDDWQQSFAMYGDQGVTIGGESMDGGTLTVSEIGMFMDGPDNTVTATIPQLTFTENGDGTVAVGFPETMPVTVVTKPFFGDPETIEMALRQSGLSITASGSEGEISYDMAADSYGVTVDRISSGDQVMETDIAVNMNGLSGTYVSTTGNLRTVDYDLSAQEVVAAVDVADPEGTGRLVFDGRIDGLDTAFAISTPLDMDIDNPDSMFVDGFAASGGYTFGASTYDFSFNERGDSVQGTASAGGGELSVSMDLDGISYTSDSNNIQVAVSGSDIPFPIEASVENYGINLLIPLSASDTPREFALGANITGLSVNDMIWSMIDPGQALPRDPATVDFDLSGTVTPFFDFLDPAQESEMMMADMPGELNTVALNDLLVSIAGAELTGDGAFTFDNTDMSTFPGFPRPEGQVNLALSGANGLMDNLIQMGLVPEDQMMGARMMLGMFATPVGDDELTSTLEINAQGHVLANGQRLQ